MFKRKYILVACFFLLTASLKTKSLDADVYVHTDKDGVLHFSAVPKEGYRAIMREKNQSDPPKEESGAPVSPKDATSPRSSQTIYKPGDTATNPQTGEKLTGKPPVADIFDRLAPQSRFTFEPPTNQPETNSSPLDVYIILLLSYLLLC